MKKIVVIVLWMILMVYGDLVVTMLPTQALGAQDTVVMRWSGGSDEEHVVVDSARIFLSLVPGGGILTNYPHEVTEFLTHCIDTEDRGFNEKESTFFPSDQSWYIPGVYYGVLMHVTSEGDTLISREFQLLFKHPSLPRLYYPVDTINEVAPLFRWERYSTVPYFHLFLTDDAIVYDPDNPIEVSSLHIVWDTITSDTTLQYDLTHQPALISATTYSWVVLNNYSGTDIGTVQDLPHNIKSFTTPLVSYEFTTPQLFSPALNDTFVIDQDPILLFRWSNSSTQAVSYQLRISKEIDDGPSVEVYAQMYTAQTFGDTAEVALQAASLFSTGTYQWQIIALDSNGVGFTDTVSSFVYLADRGEMTIATQQLIVQGEDSIITMLGTVGITFEVIRGVFEKQFPLLTSSLGTITTDKPIGRYRVVATKKGFLPQAQEVEIVKDSLTTCSFVLERSSTTLYGEVRDSSGVGLAGVAITAVVKDSTDTLYTESDNSGNYHLQVYGGVWEIFATKRGYSSDSTITISIDAEENREAPPFTLTSHPYVLSGIVQDSNRAVVSAMVKLYTLGKELITQTITNSSGAFEITSTAGEYLLEISKEGYVTDVDTLVITHSEELVIPLTSQSSIIQGTIIGRRYSLGDTLYYPLGDATILCVSNQDTLITTTSSIGSYTITIPSQNEGYTLYCLSAGYPITPLTIPDSLEEGTIFFTTDTITQYAQVSGVVQYETDTITHAYISCISTTSKEIVYQSQNSTAHFRTVPLADDTYTLTASKDSLYTRQCIAHLARGGSKDITTFISSQGVILTEELERIDSITIALQKGGLSFVVTAPYKSDEGSTFHPCVSLVAPYPLQLATGDTLQGQPPGEYHFIVYDTLSEYLQCSMLQHLEQTDTLYPVVIPMVYSHRPPSISSNSDSVILRIDSWDEMSSPLDSAYVYYRFRKDNSYQRIRFARDTRPLRIALPLQSGMVLQYYFSLYSSDSVIYGNASETYEITLPQDTLTITALAIFPTSSSAWYALAPKSTTLFTLAGYYGTAYDSLQLPQSYIDSITSRHGVEVTLDRRQNQFFVTTSHSALIDTLDIFLDTTRNYSLDSSIATPLQMIIKVLEYPLDSVEVVRQDTRKLLSGESTQFKLQGFDTQGNSVVINGHWSVQPKMAGNISSTGLFKASSDFIGEALILGSYNDTLYDTYDCDSVDRIVIYAPSTPHKRCSYHNAQGVELTIDSTAIIDDKSVLFSLQQRTAENQMRKAILENSVTIISNIYEVEISTPTDLSNDEGSITLTQVVPQEYTKYLSGNYSDTTLYKVALFNQEKFYWDYVGRAWSWSEESDTIADSLRIPSTSYNVEEKSVTLSLTPLLTQKRKSQLTLVMRNSHLEEQLVVSPNPFSPMVSPLKQYIGLEGMSSDIKGTCIKFTPPSRQDVYSETATVTIYTPAGDMVWRANLGTVYSGQPYYLFWDGRTRLHRNSKSQELVVESNRVIYAPGTHLCRNGRYFVTITFDDGGSHKEHITQEIVLFK